MQYRFVSVLAAGVLVGVTSAAPVPSAEVRHHHLVGVGHRTTIVILPSVHSLLTTRSRTLMVW